MHSVKLKSRVGADGILTLQVPVGLTDTELEVLVVVQPLEPDAVAGTPEVRGWPPGFFEETFGAWKGEPLERPKQGDYEQRAEHE